VRLAPRLLAPALVAGLLGCVTLPEFRTLEREVRELREGRVTPAAGGGAGGVSEGRLADLGNELLELRAELEDLRGELEEVRHMAELARKDAETARGASLGQPSEAPAAALPPEGGTAATETAAPATPGPEVAPEAASAALSEELQGYEEGFRYYRAQNYEKAVERFRTFLQSYPESEYADNALFWLGECYLKQGDHERAILAFEDVTKRYPRGNKVADALYRQGIALLEMGKRTGQEDAYRPAARDVFERILRDYPDSDRVPEARRQLERIGT
jgi:tol-pal system protein YbgF